MALKQDYLNKYRPLLYLLSSEADLDCLAAEPGYSRALGREHRRSRLNLVRGYLLELQEDFRMLYEAAIARAVRDPDLATQLVATQESLASMVRDIRRRLWMERFIPTPIPAPKPGLFRRLIVRGLHTDSSAQDLLVAMNSIARRISPTFN